MSYFILVLLKVIMPILILLAIGVILQKKFKFNLRALSNLITYCLMPSAVFVNVYETSVEMHVLAEIISYLLIFSLLLMTVGTWFGKLLKLNKAESAVFKNSVVLINSGNYGIPVSQLIFHSNPLGISIQIIVVVFQNIITYTYGLFNLISATKSGLEILKDLMRMPIIHALLIGAMLNLLNIGIPEFLWIPVTHLGNAMISIALITLGAQLSEIQIQSILNKIMIFSSLGRLVIGPAMALGLIFIMGLDGVVAQSLFIASSFPTSRNSSTLALEYDVEPNLAAQIVLFSTIVSSISVAFVIYLSTVLFT